MCEMIMNFFKGIKIAIKGNHIKLDDPDWRDFKWLEHRDAGILQTRQETETINHCVYAKSVKIVKTDSTECKITCKSKEQQLHRQVQTMWENIIVEWGDSN
mgnify:FL=1